MTDKVEDTNGATDHRNEDFRRVVAKRVNNALGAIALIEQMSSSGNYKYTMEEVEVMLTAIETAVTRVRQRYILALTRQSPTKAKQSFKF